MALMQKKSPWFNIHNVLSIGQMTGYAPTRLSDVPGAIIEDANERFKWYGVVALVCELDYHYPPNNHNYARCLNALKGLHTILTHRIQTEEPQDSMLQVRDKCFNVFMECNGLNVLQRILMLDSLHSQESVDETDLDEIYRIKGLCLDILHQLVIIRESAAIDLSQHQDVLHYLFTLLASKKIFVNACTVIEDILQYQREMLNLSEIPNISELIQCMNDKQLANFCRILAVTVSDLDLYENKSSLWAQNKQKRSKGFMPVRDINQELLLKVPNVLQRFTDIACNLPYIPRHNSVLSEIENWMIWIENRTAEEMEGGQVDDLEAYMGGISTTALAGSAMLRQPGLEIGTELMHRVEVIYVLGLFLVGKHRKKVQKQLAEIKLIPGLSDLFDQFIWKCSAHGGTAAYPDRLQICVTHVLISG